MKPHEMILRLGERDRLRRLEHRVERLEEFAERFTPRPELPAWGGGVASRESDLDT